MPVVSPKCFPINAYSMPQAVIMTGFTGHRFCSYSVHNMLPHMLAVFSSSAALCIISALTLLEMRISGTSIHGVMSRWLTIPRCDFHTFVCDTIASSVHEPLVSPHHCITLLLHVLGIMFVGLPLECFFVV